MISNQPLVVRDTDRIDYFFDSAVELRLSNTCISYGNVASKITHIHTLNYFKVNEDIQNFNFVRKMVRVAILRDSTMKAL